MAGKSACFGYEDGSVKVWDLKEGSPLVTMTPPHTEAVTCMAAHHDGKLLISGSADTTAKLTTINSGKVTPYRPLISLLVGSPDTVHTQLI